MNLLKVPLRFLLLALLVLFGCIYPFAVIGVAFDVKPSFSLTWAGGAMLFLEGTLLLVAAALLYGIWHALSAGLLVVVLSYLVETMGVNTGFPFGSYRYTDALFPRLPGSVPLAVMFAWILTVFGIYGWVKRSASARRGMSVKTALLGALLAMLLDLAIEPVAAHIVMYWEWFKPGLLNYYGVPLENFGAWFVVACILLLLVDGRLDRRQSWRAADIRAKLQGWGRHTRAPLEGKRWMGTDLRLAVLTPRILFSCSLFMFGLVDLTHGYYWGTFWAICAGLLLYVRSRLYSV